MKNYVILPLIIGLIIGAIIPIQSNKTINEQSLGTLTITVRDAEGNIIKQYKQPIHSPTKQFESIIKMLFIEQPSDTYTYVTDVNGNTIRIGINDVTTSYTYTFLNIGQTTNRVFIVFGNGSNPSFSITKYKLDSEVAKVVASNPSIGTSSNNITISISGSYSPNTTINITEVGIVYEVEIFDSTENNFADLLIVYDVLSTPVQVPAGGSMTVTYNFVINI